MPSETSSRARRRGRSVAIASMERPSGRRGRRGPTWSPRLRAADEVAGHGATTAHPRLGRPGIRREATAADGARQPGRHVGQPFPGPEADVAAQAPRRQRALGEDDVGMVRGVAIAWPVAHEHDDLAGLLVAAHPLSLARPADMAGRVAVGEGDASTARPEDGRVGGDRQVGQADAARACARRGSRCRRSRPRRHHRAASRSGRGRPGSRRWRCHRRPPGGRHCHGAGPPCPRHSSREPRPCSR